MADYQDVVVINEGYEIRTSGSGKERVTIKVTAEPIIHNFDPKGLGRGPAKAIAFHLAEKVRGIAEVAPEATLKARKVAAKAFSQGKSWALERYSGGRMGPMEPNKSDRAFNDSERMEESITAGYSEADGAWRVNVAANRLNSQNSGGVERMWEKLVRLVPEFGDAALLLSQDLVKAAIQKAQHDIMHKAEATSLATTIEAAQAVIALVEAAIDLAEVVG